MGGKKKGQSGLGKAVMKDRFKAKPHKANSFLHTTDVQDGYEWGRLNLQSVTEQSNLDDFLATAQLAGTEFTAEKLNVRFVHPALEVTPSREQLAQQSQAQYEHRTLLKVPRRPGWDALTTPEDLDRREKDAFLEWRRQLAELGEKEHIVLTPFEKNLEFWRQLWRVVERSDVVVQIVDARNPLLYRCEDLELYVHELSDQKLNLVLVNKADYLTHKQRKYWYDYFQSKGVEVVFWSAVLETERLKAMEARATSSEEDSCDASDEDSEDDPDSDLVEDSESDDSQIEISQPESSRIVESSKAGLQPGTSQIFGDSRNPDGIVNSELPTETDSVDARNLTESRSPQDETQNPSTSTNTSDSKSKPNEDEIAERLGLTSLDSNDEKTSEIGRKMSEIGGKTSETGGKTSEICGKTSEIGRKMSDIRVKMPETGGKESESESESDEWRVLNGEELTEMWKGLHAGRKVTEGVTTVGLVGYPNVGKSSTINALLKTKKVPVSATPGRTKHFQTLYLEKDLLLCDCPGLVMPSFVSTKADMVVSGILPIDQMRDYQPPVQLVCNLLGRPILEKSYGLNLPPPLEGEDPTRPPTAHELLNAYGYMRGFMTQKGLPDMPRSSRIILKDFVNGKLLFRHPPPDVTTEEYESAAHPEPKRHKAQKVLDQQTEQGEGGPPVSHIDKAFFRKVEPQIHARGKSGPSSMAASSTSQETLDGKPWKKHHNKGKKEKLRRQFAHLDKH